MVVAVYFVEGVSLLLGSMQDIGDFFLLDLDVEWVEYKLHNRSMNYDQVVLYPYNVVVARVDLLGIQWSNPDGHRDVGLLLF